jgi:hypothetical protein
MARFRRTRMSSWDGTTTDCNEIDTHLEYGVAETGTGDDDSVCRGHVIRHSLDENQHVQLVRPFPLALFHDERCIFNPLAPLSRLASRLRALLA